MNTLAEIEAAVDSLPVRQQKVLMGFLARRVACNDSAPARRSRGLKAAARPALEGLPARLSVGTRERVKRLVAQRHATDR
jgi:hypothetical protein